MAEKINAIEEARLQLIQLIRCLKSSQGQVEGGKGRRWGRIFWRRRAIITLPTPTRAEIVLNEGGPFIFRPKGERERAQN